MSDQEIVATAETQAETSTLFDELADLVPRERLTEYYRVIAHTRTLSPNDEMLRILEAMGVLALLTRETPAAIAAERNLLAEGSGNVGVASQCSRETNGNVHITTRIAARSTSEGIGNRAGPASHCEVARRKPSTVISAFRSARHHKGAWSVVFRTGFGPEATCERPA